MIKLTLQVGAQHAEKVFEQESVVLGADSADIHGLPLDAAALRPEHVKIFEKDGIFFAQNLANDPFVTLNGRPFGKKRLTPGDRLSIGGAEITIDGQSKTIPKILPQPQSLESLNSTLDHVINSNVASTEEEELDVDALIREVENFSSAAKPSQQEPAFKANPLQGALTEMQARVGRETIARQGGTENKHWTPRSLRNRPLGKFHYAADDSDASGELKRFRYWRPLIATLIVLVAVLAAIGSGVYFTFNEKNDAQEFIAAQSLADMSMALTYAQIHQIKPLNQNWGDPDFLHEILLKILPPDYPSLVAIDKQGTFQNCPYMLRVYTSGDLSQFLLIAQPEPNLWQWLLSRETILLDSRTMELHKTKDLRALNRLLANPKPLEGANALEISHLVSQTSLVRLTTVASETGHREYLPPQGLNKQRPGAEIRVYNAPRYYLFSTPVTQGMGQLVDLPTDQISDERIQELRKNVHDLTKMSHFVFYSKDDESTSRKVLDLLRTWISPEAAIVAQLIIENGTNGHILSSYVLNNKPYDGTVQHSAVVSKPAQIVLAEKQAEPPSPIAEQKNVHAVIQEALQGAAERRRQALLPYKQQLVQLLDDHVTTHNPNFAQQIDGVVRDFEDVELGQQVDIRQAIVDAYRIHVIEGRDLSHDQFVGEVKEAELESFLPPEFLVHTEAPVVAAEPSAEHANAFANSLEEIQQSQDIQSLEHAVADANQELTSEPLISSERLRTLRNKLQVHVLHRLEQLVLGASSPLGRHEYNQHNRARIQKILLSAGIEDPEQRDYYLREFDLLTQQKAIPDDE